MGVYVGSLRRETEMPDDAIDRAKEDLAEARAALADAHRHLEALTEPAGDSEDLDTDRGASIDLGGGGGSAGGGITDD